MHFKNSTEFLVTNKNNGKLIAFKLNNFMEDSKILPQVKFFIVIFVLELILEVQNCENFKIRYYLA